MLGLRQTIPVSVGEQKHFANRGFREPKRCELCRIRREFGDEAVATLLEIEEEEDRKT